MFALLLLNALLGCEPAAPAADPAPAAEAPVGSDGRRHDGLVSAVGLMESGRTSEALRMLSDILQAEPTLAAGWRLQGEALLRSGALEPAEQSLLRAAALDSQSADSRELLGMVYYQQARSSDCVQALSDALRLDPLRGPAWLNRAGCYRALGEAELAQRDLGVACDLGVEAACQHQAFARTP